MDEDLTPTAGSPAPRIDYARELNPQQYAAVTAPPGPALVLAGAGAGKTRTLVYRVAYLLEQGIPPEAILLLTFTNKAAHEMMRRVAELLGTQVAGLWGGTFHSIGNRILRAHAHLLGLPGTFTILDREDARSLLNQCLKDAKDEFSQYRLPKADALGDVLSLAASLRRPVSEVIEKRFAELEGLSEVLQELNRRYAARKREAGVVDFDDLLLLWLRLFEEHPDVCERYQRRFLFVLVDEYQDTNAIQGELVDLLAARHRNLMAVGDDSQSIYSWRGANFLNILQFPQRHAGAHVFRIETNYRSTPEVLALANAAIAPNVRQHPKELRPARPAGPKPVAVTCFDARQQAAFLAAQAQRLHQDGIPWHEIAVLYRSHFHALEIQLELTTRNIPFAITSGIRVFEQAHVKDVLSFLKLCLNPADEVAFRRLVVMLPGIGPKAADKLWLAFGPARQGRAPAAKTKGKRTSGKLAAALPPPPPAAPTDASPPTGAASQATSPAASLQALLPLVPPKAQVEWTSLAITLSLLEDKVKREAKPSELISLVLQSGYRDYLDQTYDNAYARQDDLNQLARYAEGFPNLTEFLTQLALLSDIEVEAERKAREDSEAVRLSSIHQAKGLEFRAVFVVMLCEGLFPSARSSEHEDSLEEERRLFYVAVTRAKDHLYLITPLSRQFGTADYAPPMEPSRFLDAIDPALFERVDLLSRYHSRGW